MSEPLVECHSGYTYAQRPIALRWQGVRLLIQDVEAYWRIPDGPCFRIRTEDGQVFELFYSESSAEWQIREP
jgi:hypothetical protein